jgi:hypothetical protein
VVTGAPGSKRARLRLGVAVLLAVLAALWAVLGLRLFIAPPTGIASSLASVVGLFSLIDALVYGLAARWVAVQKRWGHIVAIVVVAINLLLGFTAQMTWLEWGLLGANLVTVVLLALTVPRRR